MRKLPLILTLATLALSSCGAPEYGELPALDLGGKEFVVLHAEAVSLTPEEVSGDKVDKALYRRQQRLEEAFNLKLVERVVGDPYTECEQSILCAEHKYDLIIGLEEPLAPQAELGYFYDLSGFGELRLDAEWWDSDANDAIELNPELILAGERPLVVTDIIPNEKRLAAIPVTQDNPAEAAAILDYMQYLSITEAP